MNAKILLPALFLLNACSPNETAAPAAPAAASAVSEPAAANSVQTLTSSDGKIRITLENGQFRDAMQDQSLHPQGLNAGELTLLRQDPNSGITLYAANLGEAKTDAKTYFGNLKETLKAAGNMENLRIGIATDNRMNYRFTQAGSDGLKLSESCMAVHETNIYTVCAASPSASAEELDSVLKNINLVK